MGIFARKRENGAGAAVQLREGGRHPFGVLDGYVPLSQGEMELYRSIREAVPIVDAALRKLVRLAGGVVVEVPTYEENAYRPDEQELRRVITSRTRAIIINTPCNPTGAAYDRDTLEMLAGIAKEFDLLHTLLQQGRQTPPPPAHGAGRCTNPRCVTAAEPYLPALSHGTHCLYCDKETVL